MSYKKKDQKSKIDGNKECDETEAEFYDITKKFEANMIGGPKVNKE